MDENNEKIDEIYTSLRVTKELRDKLIKFRLYKRETHEEVIERLMIYYIEKNNIDILNK